MNQFHKFCSQVGAWFADAKAKAGSPRISVSCTVEVSQLKRIVANAEKCGSESVKLSVALWPNNTFVEGSRMPAMTGSASYCVPEPLYPKVQEEDTDGITNPVDNIIRSIEADTANNTVNAKVVRRGRPKKVEAPAFSEAQMEVLRSLLTSR